MTKPPDPPHGLMAVGPREWMNVWVRVIAPSSVKLVGAMAAHYANYDDGSDIHPGNATLAAVCGGMGNKTVIEALAQMREWGLIWRYREGRKQGRRKLADVYRLTFPDDVLDRVPMLDPDYRKPVDNPP